MAYGRGRPRGHENSLYGAAVSHSAELVRGDYRKRNEGPLIRPSGTFPRGEGVH